MTLSPEPDRPTSELSDYDESSNEINDNEKKRNIYLNLMTEEDFGENALDPIEITKEALSRIKRCKISPLMRKKLRNFENSSCAAQILIFAERILDYSSCAEVQQISKYPSISSLSNQKGLFASRDIECGEFVLPSIDAFITSPEEAGRNLQGYLLPNIILYDGLQRDFSFYRVEEVQNGRKRRRNPDTYLKRKELCIIKGENSKRSHSKNYDSEEETFGQSIFEKYVLCIDMSLASEEAKSVRRSCEPNLTIRYVFMDHRMEVFMTAKRDIGKGQELTIAHDLDYCFSPRTLNCAHSNKNEAEICNFEAHRQYRIQQYVEQVEDSRRMKKMENRQEEEAEKDHARRNSKL